MAKFCNQCGKPIPQDANFCTICGTAIAGKAPVRTEWKIKKDRVVGRQGKNKNLKNVFIAGCLIGFSVLTYYVWPKGGGNKVISDQPVVIENVNYGNSRKQMTDIPSKIENGKIIISLDAVKEKKFVAFNYETANKTVPLLAYISGEGRLVTAVSMCEPCDSRRFHIRGNQLVCNSCGSTWDIDDLKTISGSCGKYPPDAIPSVVAGNQVLIDEAIVKRWTPRI